MTAGGPPGTDKGRPPLDLERALGLLRELGPAPLPETLEERVFRAATSQPRTQPPPTFVETFFAATWRAATAAVVVTLALLGLAALQTEGPAPPPAPCCSFRETSMPELDADTFLGDVLDGWEGSR